MAEKDKSDCSFFVYYVGSNSFYRWTNEEDRYHRDPRDIDLHEYLPLTPESLSILQMTYPSIDIDAVQEAIKAWDRFTVDGQGYYVYTIGKDVWE